MTALQNKPITMVLLMLIRTFNDEVLDSTTIVAMPHFRVTTLLITSWRGLELEPLELVLVGIPKGIGGESQMFIECILGILWGPILSFTHFFFFFFFFFFFLLVNHLGLEIKIVSSLPGKDMTSSLFEILLQDGQGGELAKNFI
jgi:hypothetical protein